MHRSSGWCALYLRYWLGQRLSRTLLYVLSAGLHAHSLAPLLGMSAQLTLRAQRLTPLMPAAAQTLCCANTVDDGLLQVTPLDVRVVDAGTGALVHQWKAPPGLQINTASASPTQVTPASWPCCSEQKLALSEPNAGLAAVSPKLQ